MDDINREFMAQELTIPETGAEAELAVQEPEDQGLTQWEKVGVGTGIAAGTGLAAFGLYKLGVRLGWWGQRTAVIVIDDPADGGSDGKSDGSNTDAPRPSRRDRAIGKPPNISGDPEGYNTTLFPNPTPVRVALNKLGYNVTYDGGSLVPDGEANPEVRRFQTDWTRVIEGIDDGRVKLPSSVPQPNRLKHFRGRLASDGIPGKNTLNGLEIALANQEHNKLRWRDLVKKVRS